MAAGQTHATARIVDGVCHESIDYRAKDFDSQRSYRITFEIERNVGRRSRRALVCQHRLKIDPFPTGEI
jgi:hypothetical protein